MLETSPKLATMRRRQQRVFDQIDIGRLCSLSHLISLPQNCIGECVSPSIIDELEYSMEILFQQWYFEENSENNVQNSLMDRGFESLIDMPSMKSESGE